MSIVPLAANTIAIATELDVHPEESTIAVFLSTIFALFYIPLIITFFL
jgi:predicted permease